MNTNALQLCIQMHFAQIEFRSAFLLLHTFDTRHAVQSHQTARSGGANRHAMPLKALIKFSQSNQIILKSFLSPFAGLVSESSRQVPKAGASGAAEGVQQQRAHHAREE